MSSFRPYLRVGWVVLFSVFLVLFGLMQPVQAQGKLDVYATFSTPVEEPWVSVVHEAWKHAEEQGKVNYEYQDNLGYAGDLERELRRVAVEQEPDVFTGDAFGNEEAVRRVARQFPDIAFVYGSGRGPADPNMSVFDNWIHEPAYLCGLIAGAVTESDVVGVVGGYPVPEVNRLINAFRVGIRESNPDARLLVSFINSWFDPAAAKEASLAQIDQGADVMFAERAGVIEAAQEKGVAAFGNMTDQNDQAPETVITGPVWDLKPTVDYVIKQIQADVYSAQDLKDWSMMIKDGARLAPFHEGLPRVPENILNKVRKKKEQIKKGLYRVPIIEQKPSSGPVKE